MSVAAYPAYKDTGVEGLGRVPSHWELKRLRFAATLNPTKAEIAHLDRETELSFLPMDAVGEDGSLRLDELRPISVVETGYTFFREGDVAFAKITPSFENGKGAIMRELIGGYGFGTTELTVLRPVVGIATAEFLNWIICSPRFRAFGEGSMYGAGGQKRVPDDFARDFVAGFPSVSEQTAIATFLDRETGKIDALVEEQRRLIALLKEKRQAVISHAVTKGLNPNAPMKDSGIEWLGEVPAHWEVKRLRFVASLNPSKSQIAEIDRTTELSFLPMDAVGEDGSLRLDETRSIQTVETGYTFFAEGDVTYAKITPCFENGKGAIMRYLTGGFGFGTTELTVLRAKKEIASPGFLHWLVCSLPFRSFGEGAMYGAGGQKRVPDDFTRDFASGFPPIVEQNEIVSFIANETRRIDELMEQAKLGKTLLQERRAALISAAVTGKIDVRGLVAAPATKEAA